MVGPLIVAGIAAALGASASVIGEMQKRKRVEGQKETVNAELDNLSQSIRFSQALSGIQIDKTFRDISKTRKLAMKNLDLSKTNFGVAAITGAIGHSTDHIAGGVYDVLGNIKKQNTAQTPKKLY